MIYRVGAFVVLGLILVAALMLRVPGLEKRPMHNDEGVNTVKFNDLWAGKFQYDPSEYHGPTLYYFTFPAVWFRGAKDFASTTETTYRAVPLVFGILLILLTACFAKDLGWGAALWACALTAVSPAFVFYSRYYIHEMLLVVFTLAAILCGWRYWMSGAWRWAILTGVAVGMMYATKETWVISLVAAALAIGLTRAMEKVRPSGQAPRRPPMLPMIVAAVVAILVAGIWFSGFLTHPRGILDAVVTYRTYLNRGSGGGLHDHSFGWYLNLLWWYQTPVGPSAKSNSNPIFTEAFTLTLALAGAVTGWIGTWTRRPTAPHANPAGPVEVTGAMRSIPLIRFLAFYTLLLTLLYSLIPYKTPWCVLSFLHGMILLAGVAAAQAVRGAAALAGGRRQAAFPNRPMPLAWGIGTLATLVLVWPVWQPFTREKIRPRWATTIRQAMVEPGWSLWAQSRAVTSDYLASSRHNPWVYAHTSSDIAVGVELMHQIARVHPNGYRVYGQVVTIDCWPLPWYLRRFEGIGYWPAPPERLTADVIIGPPEVGRKLEQAEERGGKNYVGTAFGLRPTVFLFVYVKQPVWEKVLELREREAALRRKK